MADASHELRTPTAVLRTEADVILAQQHRSEDEYRASLTVIRDAASRLARIVEDLFALARVDSEKFASRRERVYVEELVDDAMRMVRAARRRARRTRESAGSGRGAGGCRRGPPGSLADQPARQRDQALAGRRRGRSAHATAQAVSSTSASSTRGEGIPAEDRGGRIFQRFVRLPDGDRATHQGGVGLGLAIARRIADAHGGFSGPFVDSTPGHTEFRLTTLPIA
jgi:signal transduction histidine kinase